MEPIYRREFTVEDSMVDAFCRLRPSQILYLAQEIAGQHCDLLDLTYEHLARKRLFWAVIRHRAQITRLPQLGEKLTAETWPLPTTRVAYPRSMVVYDEQGRECFRTISLWVLMDLDTRNMILPGKSGVSVVGTVRGLELASPGSLAPKLLGSRELRQVRYTDLDRNGHMNNTRYLDWIDDLLPSAFHKAHTVQGFTMCYLSEAKEGQELHLSWELGGERELFVEAVRQDPENPAHQERVFAANILY